jgi:hemoglobin
MEKTLFERLGGRPGISMIVDDTVDAHMKNPVVNARFLPYLENPARLAKIKQHTVDFFIAGSGGPGVYSGRDSSNPAKPTYGKLWVPHTSL